MSSIVPRAYPKRRSKALTHPDTVVRQEQFLNAVTPKSIIEANALIDALEAYCEGPRNAWRADPLFLTACAMLMRVRAFQNGEKP